MFDDSVAATRLGSGEIFVLGNVGRVVLVDPTTNTASEVTPPQPGVSYPRGIPVIALPSGKVLVADTHHWQIWDPSSNAFSAAGDGPVPPNTPGCALLPSGKVLVAGGGTAAVEIYDPESRTFTPAGALAQPRGNQPALTVLRSGEVLIVGGDGSIPVAPPPEIFDPRLLTSRPAAATTVARNAPTSTLLPNGRVLVVGGAGGLPSRSAELLDPQEAISTSIATAATARDQFTMTALPSGRVLIAGGSRARPASAELFDPVNNVFTAAGDMNRGRSGHAAAVLASGALITGGGDDADTQVSAEVYSAENDVFVPVGPMHEGRTLHAMTPLGDGRVLVTGGVASDQKTEIQSAEIFDPATSTFTTTGPMTRARGNHAAVLLPPPSGQVLVLGTYQDGSTSVESFDPATRTFSAAGSMAVARHGPSAAVLPSGQVLIAGGDDQGSSELYDLASGTSRLLAATPVFPPRPALTLLPDGDVLAIGGVATNSIGYLFHATGKYETVGPTAGSRLSPAATALPSGGVFLYGGSDPRAEMYLPDTRTFKFLSSQVLGRDVTLTPLANGTVLVTGGAVDGTPTPVATAQIYDSTQEPRSIGPMSVPRLGHTATLLANGEALIAGGLATPIDPVASTERYPGGGASFVPGRSMTHARAFHTATPLASGLILFVGGIDQDGQPTASAELYDPASGNFRATGALVNARSHHAAVLLSSGQVLVAGGQTYSGVGQVIDATHSEIYDPTAGTFSVGAGTFEISRASAATTSGGAVLVGGGELGAGPNTLSLAPLFSIDGNLTARRLGFFSAAAIVGLVDGTVAICSVDSCAVSDGTQTATGYAPSGVIDDRFSATATRTGAGDVFVMSSFDVNPALANKPTLHPLWWNPLPARVVRPTITGAPAVAVAGVEVQLHGTRFTRPSAAGSEGAGPRLDVIPTAVFAPADGSAAVASKVTAWSDTSMTWVPPTTVHRGPGWVHVVVQGVPSNGAFLELQAAASGTACTRDTDCATGVCAAGVCCNRPCGACETCRAALQGPGGRDGICRAVAADTDPANACDLAPAGTCGLTGVCDGNGACARDPDGTSCGTDGRCAGGVCCGTGGCLTPCASTLDCPQGSVCLASRICGAAEFPGQAMDSGGCALGAGHSPSWAALAAVSTLAMRRRKRRQRDCNERQSVGEHPRSFR
jgi:hypothetical protein